MGEKAEAEPKSRRVGKLNHYFMKRQVSFEEFKKSIVDNPQLQTRLQDNPISLLEEFEDHPLVTDKWIYRIITVVIGLTLLTTVLGFIIMSIWYNGKPLSDAMIAIGSSAIGALAGVMMSPVKK